MPRRPVFYCFVLLAFAVVLAEVSPASAADKKPSIAAFIDADKSALGALLEARLVAGGAAQWVERARIDKALKEQRLQALFSPAAIGERSKLGQLLQADVLVILRKAPAKAIEKGDAGPTASQVDLVVSETATGLRLASQSIAATSDPTADAERLEEFVEHALARAGGKRLDIVAIPPFVSHDLSFRLDYLKRAFADVIEGALLHNQEIAVVELAEAEALAREIALHPGAIVERPLPLYVLGEYRHDGEGEARRLKLSLKLVRGKLVVGSAHENDLRPDDVPGFLQRNVTALFEKSVATRQSAPDSAAEAGQLAARAREAMRLGNWDDAMPLLEASLLLQPDNLSVRRDAIIVSNRIGIRYFYHRTDPKISIPALKQWCRGLEHIEVFLTAVPDLSPYKTQGRSFISEYRFTIFRGNAPHVPEITTVYDEVITFEKESLLRIVRLRAKQKAGDDWLFMTLATEWLSPEEKAAMISKALTELQDLPGADERKQRYTDGWSLRSRSAKVSQAGRQLTPGARKPGAKTKSEPPPRTAAVPNPNGDEAGQASDVAIPEPVFPSSETAVEFQKVTLEVEGRGTLGRFGGIVPAGKGVDLVWGNDSLFLMREPGKLKQIWHVGRLNDRFSNVSNDGQYVGDYVVFDGRFVWVSVASLDHPPMLLVVDPVRENVWTLSDQDGLPLVAEKDVAKEGSQQYLGVAAIGPGKACVVGTFGRTWIAIVSFDPDQGAKVKLIHESRNAVDPLAEDAWKSADVAFEPTYMYTLRDPKSQRCRIVVGRGSKNHHLHYHPLLVDPVREIVEPTQDKLPAFQTRYNMCTHDGGLYFMDRWRDALPQIAIGRLGFPELRCEQLLTVAPIGWIAFDDDQLLVIGKRWWSRDKTDGNLRTAPVTVPWYFSNGWAYPGQRSNPEFGVPIPPGRMELAGTFESSHYGLIIQTRPRNGSHTALYQVKTGRFRAAKAAPEKN